MDFALRAERALGANRTDAHRLADTHPIAIRSMANLCTDEEECAYGRAMQTVDLSAFYAHMRVLA